MNELFRPERGPVAAHADLCRHRAIVFPGQGIQHKGMGASVLERYGALAERASDIVGYSLARLCGEDPEGRLGQTRYAQPAIFLVNALTYLRGLEDDPAGSAASFFAGHSLGEYNALVAAGALDFDAGIRLVDKRAELMAGAGPGAMMAVVGEGILQIAADVRAEVPEVEVANLNSPTQLVLSGPRHAVDEARRILAARDVRCVPLRVSGAFHSRAMTAAQSALRDYLLETAFACPAGQVISNATARPYDGDFAGTLATQLTAPVRWADSIRYLLDIGVSDFVEIGGTLLTPMIRETRESCRRAGVPANETAAPRQSPAPSLPRTRSASGSRLGSPVFRRRFNTHFAYAAGSMYRGIASPRMVVKLGQAGMLGFLGTGGLSLRDIEAGLGTIIGSLKGDEPFGANLLANPADPAAEMATVELYLRLGIRNIEAASFVNMTPALVLFRLKGARREGGNIVCDHKVLAKVSRPEPAAAFMSPAPKRIVEQLLEAGRISPDQAEIAAYIPMAHDICVEADSGGHTDGRTPTVLLPSLLRLRSEIGAQMSYAEPICMGQAGGIGTPESAAAAFLMGADFIVTGSINQCTVEAGTSEAVKERLQDIDIQDTDYAPAGDLFESGGKVQVLKKGVFFPARARKLLLLYQTCTGIADIPAAVRTSLEASVFRRGLDDVWMQVEERMRATGREGLLARAAQDAKFRMSCIFRWYFAYSNELAIEGDPSDPTNYQVQTGPAMGSLNRWLKGTARERWSERRVDELGGLLMDETAAYLAQRCREISASVGR